MYILFILPIKTDLCYLDYVEMSKSNIIRKLNEMFKKYNKDSQSKF